MSSFEDVKKDLHFDMDKNHFVSLIDANVLAVRLSKDSTFWL